MNPELIQGVLFGGFAGLLLAVILRRSKRDENNQKDALRMNNEDSVKDAAKSSSLLDRWSVRLALLGVVMGIFTTLGQGYTNIGFMIGFGLPFALILGSIGLVIDIIKGRKR